MRPGDRLLGATVASALRAPWGFTNETWRVDLTDGRRLAVQRFGTVEAADRRASMSRDLTDRFTAVGLPPLPSVRWSAGDVVVTDWVEGRVGSDLLEGGAAPVALASAAGSVAVALRRVDVAGLDLPEVWASADRLADASLRRLAAADLSAPARKGIQTATESLPERFAGRSAVFAHGDLNPTNVIVEGNARIVALLDTEFARLAHPAFDVSWWDWVIRFHYPAVWPVLREAFEATAGLDQSSRDDVLVLQKLRSLELLASATPASRSLWLERVEQTAMWR